MHKFPSYLSGRVKLVDTPAIIESVFKDAKHCASRDEVLFELLIERAMHTRWEGFRTPDYRPIHTIWPED